jgi:hypothetical protein
MSRTGTCLRMVTRDSSHFWHSCRKTAKRSNRTFYCVFSIFASLRQVLLGFGEASIKFGHTRWNLCALSIETDSFSKLFIDWLIHVKMRRVTLVWNCNGGIVILIIIPVVSPTSSCICIYVNHWTVEWRNLATLQIL